MRNCVRDYRDLPPLTIRSRWWSDWLQVVEEERGQGSCSWLCRAGLTPRWWILPSPAASSTGSASRGVRRSRSSSGTSDCTSVPWRPCTTSLTHNTQHHRQSLSSFSCYEPTVHYSTQKSSVIDLTPSYLAVLNKASGLPVTISAIAEDIENNLFNKISRYD